MLLTTSKVTFLSIELVSLLTTESPEPGVRVRKNNDRVG